MRRTIEITVPPASTNTVLEELEQLEHVIGLSVERGHPSSRPAMRLQYTRSIVGLTMCSRLPMERAGTAPCRWSRPNCGEHH